jgi:hypothetical protein
MIVTLLILLAVFLLSFFWSPPRPIQIIVWVILAVALILTVFPIPLRW